MKKLIALLLAFAMAMSMTGCGSKEPTETPKENPNKSYTVSDEVAAAARNEVVATLGDKVLTNGVLQVYYYMGIYAFMGSDYGAYPQLYGLDYSQPLDQQKPVDADETWQEYFLEDAISTWHVYQLLSACLEKEGLELPQDQQDALTERMEQLKEAAEKQGFDSLDKLIQSDAGAGCTVEDYIFYTKTYYEYRHYILLMMDRVTYTDADLEAYFQKNKESMTKDGITKDSGDAFSVRHVLICPEGGTTDSSGKTTYSDAEWENCRVKAQELLDQWAAGEATEDSFAQLAREQSEDPGSSADGGLYEGLGKDTSFVEPFKNWYLEEGREKGDYGLVKTEYGYHIMYLSDIEPEWVYYCRTGFVNDSVTEAIEKLKTDNPYTVDYDKIVIAEVNLAANS